LPPVNDCLLLRASRNIGTKSERNSVKVECESFALQEFLALAARGEDVAISMLHVDNRHVISGSPLFTYLRTNRARFYTSRMAGMVGYARGMAAKYALRADRMDTVVKVIAVLESLPPTSRLAQWWDQLPTLPHTRFFENPADRGADKRIYEVCGKGLPATITPAYGLGIMEGLRDSYGERVKAARGTSGADLKAISHSFRVGYQLKHIYQDGDFYFPLPETDFIKAVKTGKLNYVDDKLDEKLNDLISEVERLAETSTYPESVDRTWLDRLVLEAYGVKVPFEGMTLSYRDH